MRIVNQVPLAVPVKKGEAKYGIKHFYKKLLKPDKRKIILAIIIFCVFVLPYILVQFIVFPEKDLFESGGFFMIFIIPGLMILLLAYIISLIFYPLRSFIGRTGMGNIMLFFFAILAIIIPYIISCWIIWLYDKYKKK